MSGTLDVNGLQTNQPYSDTQGTQPAGAASEIRQFEAEIQKLLQELEAGQQGTGQAPPSQAAPSQAASDQPGAQPQTAAQPQAAAAGGSAGGAAQSAPPSTAPPSTDTASAAGGASQQPSAGVDTAGNSGASQGAAATSGTPTTSAGTGPNAIQVTNTTSAPMTIGKFKNGESTTSPSAEITLQPGQTGTLHYENGEAGYAAKADSSGQFQPNASRLEYEADADGKMKYPDVSYIDGRNASISLSDGSGLNKGDDKSIAAGAPADAVQTDSAGDKTIAGYYDGSTAQMQAGANYMQSQLGTGGAYLHPNDDTLPNGQNPMSGTQSNTLYADFGNA